MRIDRKDQILDVIEKVNEDLRRYDLKFEFNNEEDDGSGTAEFVLNQMEEGG